MPLPCGPAALRARAGGARALCKRCLGGGSAHARIHGQAQIVERLELEDVPALVLNEGSAPLAELVEAPHENVSLIRVESLVSIARPRPA
jgi:hypothetical protein